MSVFHRDVEDRTKGTAAVFVGLGVLGLPIAMLIIPMTAVATVVMGIDNGPGGEMLAAMGLFAWQFIGVLGWVLSVLYLRATQVSVGRSMLMWGSHVVFNAAFGTALLSGFERADHWPLIVAGLGYYALSGLAFHGARRDFQSV